MTSSTLQQAYNETEQDYDLKGSLNQQINSGNNNIVRIVGHSVGVAGSVDSLYFNPSAVWVKVTT